jgi:hypothetical protein
MPLSVHPAPDILGYCLAHVHMVMAAFMDCSQVIILPVVVISINMMKVNPLI